jgi:small subunit ribosomal protein S16
LAVKLRLRRMGKKKQPIYKVVAADARSPRDGKFLEAVGLYNPLTNPHTIDLKEDRVFYWLNNGAQPTDTVKSLLRQKGITLKKDLLKKGFSEEKILEEMNKWEKLKEASGKKSAGRKKKASEKSEIADKTETEVLTETENTSNTDNISQEEPGKNNIVDSTAEVKGAASGENTSNKE